MSKELDIKGRMDRIEEIVNQLNADDVSLADGRELYDEGQELLAAIREQLYDGTTRFCRPSRSV